VFEMEGGTLMKRIIRMVLGATLIVFSWQGHGILAAQAPQAIEADRGMVNRRVRPQGHLSEGRRGAELAQLFKIPVETITHGTLKNSLGTGGQGLGSRPNPPPPIGKHPRFRIAELGAPGELGLSFDINHTGTKRRIQLKSVSVQILNAQGEVLYSTEELKNVEAGTIVRLDSAAVTAAARYFKAENYLQIIAVAGSQVKGWITVGSVKSLSPGS
jgi:hypothetical protein